MGSTNDVVYPVRGGMEEWGYAASWFNRYNKVKTVPIECENHIPVEVTEGSNRCLVLLVESEMKKKPSKSELGNNQDVFLVSNNTRDFWIPVLMRQLTVVLDVLRPYSILMGVSSKNVRWNVGGCYEVDETFVMIFRSNEAFHRYVSNAKNPVYSDLTDFEYDSLLHLVETEKPVFVSSSLNGVSSLRDTPKTSYNPGVPENQLIFETFVELDNMRMGKKVVIIAVSRVDQFMTRVPENENPSIPPQSLFVSLRTNGSWMMRNEKTGRELRGRGKVLSRPVEVLSDLLLMKQKDGNGESGKSVNQNELNQNELNHNQNETELNYNQNESNHNQNESNHNQSELNQSELNQNQNETELDYNQNESNHNQNETKMNGNESKSSQKYASFSLSDFNTKLNDLDSKLHSSNSSLPFPSDFNKSAMPLKLVYFHNNLNRTDIILNHFINSLDVFSIFIVFFPLTFLIFLILASILFSVF